MKQVTKGNFGYTISHRKKQGIKALCYAATALALFILGFLTTKTKLNYMTIFAMVGVLPSTKELIGFFMSFQRKPMPEELYEKIERAKGSLEVIYELVFTTSEKSYPVDAVVIFGSNVIGYTSDSRCEEQKLQEHIKGILKENGYHENVRIFRQLNPFLERTTELAGKTPEDIAYTQNERYPDLTRDQLIRHTLLAISI